MTYQYQYLCPIRMFHSAAHKQLHVNRKRSAPPQRPLVDRRGLAHFNRTVSKSDFNKLLKVKM